MKFSVFNHAFENDGRKFLYNILSTAIVEIDARIAEAINANDPKTIEGVMQKNLSDLGFIVPNGTNEMAEYQYFYDRIRLRQSASALHFSFISTYSCNLACPYCCEGSIKSNDKINQDGIDAILSFIKSEIVSQERDMKVAKLYISLYGGEPMMAKNEITSFCDGAVSMANSLNVPIDFDMPSNMTLLDERTIELIRKFKIRTQVSIDGAREQHNKRRIYPNGNGTYDVIVSNLKRLVAAGLKDLITIRINVDNETSKNAEKIFVEMLQYSDDVYFAFLTPYKGVNDGYAGKCIMSDCHSTMVVQRFNQIMARYGRNVPPTFGKKSPCAINCENKYWIDYELNVYKCELLVKMPECRVGYLSLDGVFHPEPALYRQLTLSPFNNTKCRSCKLLPLCGGGCPGTAYLNKGTRDGNVSDFQCTFSEQSLTEYLIDYVNRLKA